MVLTLIRPFRDSSKKRWNDVIFVLYDKRFVISYVPPFPRVDGRGIRMRESWVRWRTDGPGGHHTKG